MTASQTGGRTRRSTIGTKQREKLPHIKPVTAKGNLYLYFRTGQKDARGKEVLKPLPRDDSFGETYAALLGARTKRASVPTATTVKQLCDLWEKDEKSFRKYAPGTQKLYRISMSYLLACTGPDAPAGELAPEDVQAFADAKGSTPGAANSFIRTVNSLYKWGRRNRLVKNEPTKDVAEFETGEHDPWPDEILAAALAADDDRVRLGTHLLYYTAQRIEDVVFLEWEDTDDGAFDLIQKKGKKAIHIPMHRKLKAELAKHPRSGAFILRGRHADTPMNQGTIRDAIQDWVFKRFKVHVVPHGLRKNAVIALLEAGCNIAETSSISGQSLQMVEYYARQIQRKKSAKGAVKRWEDAEENAE